MAVIINDMDMPSRCDECQLVTNSECPLIGIDVDEEMGSRDMNCPLRSADEMIAEIEQVSNSDWLPCVDAVLAETQIKRKIMTIVHKYCDKEQNND